MPGTRRFAVRRSPVHGRGVFALTDFAADERIAEYKGEVISWDEAQARYEVENEEPGHTFLFDCGNGLVIDGSRGGNSSRWINHGCEPNCETLDDDGRIVIYALRPIAPGDELLIDYQLVIDGRRTAALRAQYACACGAATCRGTMLAV
jgi:SET domain-containing protein